MKVYKGCDVHPSSHLHALMDTAERSRKPEDQKKVADHYDGIHKTFQRECGLSNAQHGTRWAVGRAQ